MAGQLPVRIREREGKREIFDPVRRRFVPLTPEETVRQSYLRYLVDELGFPLIAITVEKKVVYNGMTRRYDIVACRPDGSILLLVECKAETVPLSGDTLYQAAMYNHVLHAEYVVLFNGRQQFVCRRTPEGYRPVASLPPYSEIVLLRC
ncbi:MAG: type I restriction enzyme HsdR N-terminal domain-containing protein [Bacteroidales bacterium]|nr:type I restriction enzyme HsdR N-terminal domain-containing protein [Bacteroidales bacterium]